MAVQRYLVLFLIFTIGCSTAQQPPAGGGGTGGTGGSNACPGDETAGTPAEFGLADRPANPTCIAPERPALPAAAVTLERAFGDLSFTQPIALLQQPGDSSWWYVVEQRGRVLRFSSDGGEPEVVLDLEERVDDSGMEMGLLGMAFHPDFATNGQVFLSFTDRVDGQIRSVIARFRSTDGGATIAATSEEFVLGVDQPYANHNGGHIAFGPDGMLYIGFGDGGSGGDPHGHGQNLQSRLGKLLRIDVDGGSPFAVPADNPYAQGGGDPTIWASGLRNPWRFSFDRATSALWLGDVGQNAWEEVDRIERGGNYGWNTREGMHCFEPARDCETAELIDPVAEYGRDQGQSITGGYVYRGEAIPLLEGVYLYADFVSGRMWGLFADDDGTFEPRALLDTGLSVSSFAEGNDGELFLLDWGGGGIHRIADASEPVEDTFPRRLSETGCFDPTDPTKPAPGLVPYDLIAPLWSDGAEKRRWLAIPDGATIAVAEDGDFDFPVGSVLVKEFRLGCERVETRLFVRHDDGGWAGYSYAWNAEQTDAELLAAGDVRTWGDATWEYPSRADCMRCHTAAAGFTLGPELAQLDRTMRWPNGSVAHVGSTLAHIGLLSGEATRVTTLSAPHGDARVDERARSYLHANCSGCHRPGAAGQGSLDFRIGTPLAVAGLCDAPPEEGNLGVDGARIVAPGEPDRSMVAVRMRHQGAGRMPPVGMRVLDEAGIAVVEAWIESIERCP